MEKARDDRSCPFCGLRVAAGARVCSGCNLSLRSYRGERLAAGETAGGRRQNVRSVLAAGGFVVLMSILRFFLDKAPYDWAAAAGIALTLVIVHRLAGPWATVAGGAAILSADYFIVTPRWTFGITSLAGAMTLLAAALFVLGLAWLMRTGAARSRGAGHG